MIVDIIDDVPADTDIEALLIIHPREHILPT